VTILNASSASPPAVYDLTVQMKPGSGLRNYPPTSDISTAQSNSLCASLRDRGDLTCGFGRADVYVEKVVAVGGSMVLEPTRGELRGRLTVGDQVPPRSERCWFAVLVKLTGGCPSWACRQVVDQAPVWIASQHECGERLATSSDCWVAQIVIQFSEETNRGSPLVCVGGSRAGVRCLAATDEASCKDR
jgi:hypothetical protein